VFGKRVKGKGWNMNKILKHNICILAAIAVLPCFGQLGVSRASQSGEMSANTAVIAVQKLESDFYDWHQRHKEVVELISKKQVDLIFIGDSITHMFGGLPKSQIARGSRTWETYYGHRNAINMGFGWDRTQNVLWRLENGELEGITPKVAVLLIGTNNRTGTKNARQNTPAEIVEGVSAICTTIHKKAPKCKILLLGVLPRSPRHFVKPIEAINKRLAPLDKEDYITFLNMRDQFGDEEGLPKKELMHDGVHPNAAGYHVWAKTMEPVVSKLLNDEAVMPNTLDAGDGK
jgi:lysophospholipase L1-like esterase